MKDHLRRILLVLSLLVFLPIVAGAQWRKVNAFTGTFFNEAFFSDASHGWLTSLTTTIVRTADGGATWQTSVLPNGTVSFNRDLCFLSNTTGFISGEDGIWKTADGGVTWTNITPPSFNKTGSSCSWFIDANTGVFGQGDCNSSIVRFYRTSNGGTTWDSVQYTHTPDVAVGGITYMSGTFYAAGGSGKFWTSTDNGATWTLSSTGSAGWQEDMVSSAGSLYIASADGSSCGATGSGKVLRSINGGANWITTSLPGIVMWGVTMYSATEGWTCGDNGHTYKTTDAGATWTLLACGIDPRARLDDIFFVDATNGWAVGDGIYKYVGDGYSTRPDTIDFGDVIVSTKSADSSAIVQALGGGVTITSRSLGGTDPTQFEPTGSLGFLSVLACQNAPTLVHFAPTSEGVKTSTLTFNITGPNGPETAVIFLKGRGVKPKILAQQSALFDTLLCGNVALDTFYVHNTGNYPLKISSALSPGVNGTSFTVLSPSLLSPVSIAPGDSMRFIVAAITTGPGGFTSALTINSNDPDKPVTNLGLFIYRRTVAAALDKDTLVVIPPAPLNTASSICITYRNLGDGKQTIDNVTVIPGGFDQITNTPSISKINVGVGGSQTICFSATASDTLVHTARYRIRTLPCNLDTFVTVRYQAHNPVISTATVKNLSTIVCDSAITDTIQITNTGNAPLVLTRPFFAGPDAGNFTVLAPSAWPDTVPIGGVRPVLISLLPGAAPGAHSTTITFPNNDGFLGKSKWSIPITFDRATVELTPEKRLIDLGDICLNAPTSRRIELRNSGMVDVADIAIGPIGNPNDVSISSGPKSATIAVKSRDSVTFTARPVKAGAFSSRYIVRYGPCERTDTITIVGNAVGISLAAVPPLVDFGIANVGQKVTRTFTVTNKGTAPATVRNWDFRPALLDARVLSPAPPLLLAPGESRDVIVELTPADTGAVRLMLLGAADGSCSDTLRATIDVRGIRGAITTSRYQIDFGRLLSCDLGAVPDSVSLVNGGTKPIDLRNLRLAGGSASSFVINGTISFPRTLPPGGSLPIAVSVRPDFSGSATDTLIAELDQAEQPLLAIPLTARRERVALSVHAPSGDTATSLSFTSLALCSPVEDRMLHLRNGGTVPDTVSLSTTGAGFSLRSPEQIIIPAGGDTTIIIRATMSGTGGDNGTLRVSSLPCALESVVPLDAKFRIVSAEIQGLNFSTVNVNRTVTQQTTLANTGEIAQVIDHLYIEYPEQGYAIVGDYSGVMIPAGDSIPVTVSLTPTAEGTAAARIAAVMKQPCADTIFAALTGNGIMSNVFIGARGLSYGSRFSCEDSCAVVHVEGSGDKPVTITGATIGGPAAAAYKLGAANFPITLAPGDVRDLTVCFDPSQVSGGDATVDVATDDAAQPHILLKLTGALDAGLQAPTKFSFGANGGNGPWNGSVVVTNKSDRDLTVNSAGVTPPFSIITAIPFVVPAHGNYPVALRLNASNDPDPKGTLVLNNSTPCDDTLRVALTANGDDRKTIVAIAGTVRGRWGTTVAVPITLENAQAAYLGEFDIVVTAHPGLLDPGQATFRNGAANGWTISRKNFDRKTGTLTLHLAADATAATLGTNDTLLTIDYAVLRGDSIASEIGIGITALPANVTAITRSGEFALEDFCDAYGRLLRANGTVALKQNIPNPFNPTTTIEFETAFQSHVRLAVYDIVGREVMRPIDEEMPAGRRRIELSARDLPSGVYTYRLTTGLQTLERQMILSK